MNIVFQNSPPLGYSQSKACFEQQTIIPYYCRRSYILLVLRSAKTSFVKSINSRLLVA